MCGIRSSADRGRRAESARRQVELERIKSQADAKAAEYHAVAREIESELQRASASPLPPPPLPQARAVPSEAGLARSTANPGQQRRQRLGWASWGHHLSSWVLSAAAHLALVLALGSLTLSPEEPAQGTLLTATIRGQDAAELEHVDLAELVDREELQPTEALRIQLNDPGVASLGRTEGLLSTAEGVGSSGWGGSDTMGQIGTLLGRDGRGLTSAGDGTGGATFFGVSAAGNRFAFVVDASTSMRRNGWNACRNELIAAVSRLKPHQFFYVILFNHTDHRMFSDVDPEPRPLPATPQNVARLRRWLARVPLQSGTRPRSAMEAALQVRPDAIYFLTDGHLQDDTEAFLTEDNRRKDAYDNVIRAAVIQTIGFYSPAGQEVLQRIAQDHGGTYRFVPRR